MKCSNCGTENMDSMAFCTVCGTALAAASPAPAPVQSVAPAANPIQASAPTAVADPVPPVYQAPQAMGPAPMQGAPMGPGPMQGPPMGPGPMQGPPMAPPPPPILECGQCKKPFGPDEPFCTNCGAPRQMAIARPAVAPKSSKGLKTAIIIAIAVVVLIGAAFGVYALIRENNYNNAIEQMDTGNYEEAYAAFEKLGDYKDSVAQAEECRLYVRYNEAVALMENGQYLEAKEIFDELDDFLDSYLLGQDCLNYIEYDRAVELYNEGRYYEAYVIFDDLGSFEDSMEWADKCVQPMPYTGLIEKGAAYVEGSATYYFANLTYAYNIVFLIYTESNSYWGMVFVEYRDMAGVYIEPGIYYMEMVYASTSAKWFGTTDMFGSKGTTLQVALDGSREISVTNEDGIAYG